jgi:hypothetical protein
MRQIILEDLRQCVKCKSMFYYEDIFLNIFEICEATQEKITNYEKKHGVTLQDYWCEDCTTEALKEIEAVQA